MRYASTAGGYAAVTKGLMHVCMDGRTAFNTEACQLEASTVHHTHMASGINIYSFFQISKRIYDIWKCIFDIQNTVILISDI